MGRTNYDIVTAALTRQTAVSQSGNMGTWENLTSTGHLPERLRAILTERWTSGHVSQIIYSYSTPIAWRDNGVWVFPAVSYSITTGSKHQSELYRLPNLCRIPADAGMDEYLSVVEGRSRFLPDRNRYVAA